MDEKRGKKNRESSAAINKLSGKEE